MTKSLKAAYNMTDLPNHCEDIEVAISYYDGEPDVDVFIEWFTETYIHHAEMIYYHNAIEFLSKHDPSLCESLELAHDMGFEVKKLNSETLATLLLQQVLSNELDSLRGRIGDYFDEIA